MIVRMKAGGVSRAAVALALGLTLAGCGGGNSTPSAVTKTATTLPADQQPATPNYKVVAKTTTERAADHNYSYYVVIDHVDLSNDSFKQNVQLVIKAVAKTNGNPNFSAGIYDDEATAKTEYSYINNPGPLAADEIKAQQARSEQHLVAMYDGGLDRNTAQPSTADTAYEIMWYPAASADSPNVGKYVSLGEQWKP